VLTGVSVETQSAASTIGEVPEWLNGAVSKTVVEVSSTVGSNPTLSAAFRSPSQRELQILPDFISLVVNLSKCKEFVAEIAQFTLGDLTFLIA
jgi:hypothetical protein